MKTYWGMEVQLHSFLTSALDGGEWPASRPGRFKLRYPLDRKLRGHQSRSWRGGEEKNSITAPAGNWNTVVKHVA
jgi:hypothetical protein